MKVKIENAFAMTVSVFDIRSFFFTYLVSAGPVADTRLHPLRGRIGNVTPQNLGRSQSTQASERSLWFSSPPLAARLLLAGTDLEIGSAPSKNVNGHARGKI